MISKRNFFWKNRNVKLQRRGLEVVWGSRSVQSLSTCISKTTEIYTHELYKKENSIQQILNYFQFKVRKCYPISSKYTKTHQLIKNEHKHAT